MNHPRKKLIEELIRVGRLIDPAPGTGLQESEDAMETPSITEEPDIGSPVLESDLEVLPVLDDVVGPHYATKDMFTTTVDSHVPSTTKPLRAQQPDANTSGASNVYISDREEFAMIETKMQLGQDASPIRFPVAELAQELVTLIEERVSQRSGEQLDDMFRDELTHAVTAHLEDWLEYD